MTNEYEVIIIGAGIAGASMAFSLAQQGLTDVLVLEREPMPGYHSTGRSAAEYYVVDPNPTVMALKQASADFLHHTPASFSDTPLADRSGALYLLEKESWSLFQNTAKIYERKGVDLELLSPTEAKRRVPILNPKAFAGAVLLRDCGTIDVHTMLSGYLRQAKRSGVTIKCNSEVTEVLVERGQCQGIRIHEEKFRARWVVNAAGAWAGNIGLMATASAIRMTAMRRCVAVSPASDIVDLSGWPMVKSDDFQLYFKPESTNLLMSPMDETPHEPCDVQPDDIAIASGYERLKILAPEIVPQSIKRKWAGLRTFADDRVAVIGEDPQLPGFFWLSGQGGCGIETSWIVSAVASDLLRHGRSDRFDTKLLEPKRFR